MAGAEIIGAAIGVLLLVLVGYIMVGSTLTSAEIVATAQKDLTLRNEAQLRTSIQISDVFVSGSNLYFNVSNTGNEIIGDINHMDVFITDSGSPPMHYNFSEISGTFTDKTWTYTCINLTTNIMTQETIHPKMLDPGELMWIEIDGFTTPPTITSEVKISTANGVVSSAYVKRVI